LLYVIDTVYITYALYMVCIVCTVSIVYTVYILIVALSRGFLVFSEIFLTWKKAFEKFSAAERRYSPSAGGRLRPLPRPVIGYTKAPAMPASGNVLPLPLAPYTADERRRQSNYPLHSPNNHKF
jgi:hypothetical protein